jgi:hypothetical protein
MAPKVVITLTYEVLTDPVTKTLYLSSPTQVITWIPGDLDVPNPVGLTKPKK